jgi:hypothetical protein
VTNNFGRDDSINVTRASRNVRARAAVERRTRPHGSRLLRRARRGRLSAETARRLAPGVRDCVAPAGGSAPPAMAAPAAYQVIVT